MVIGNDNVALDIARVLTMNPDDLARTDIADHALDVLRHSMVSEVVIVSRRGPAQAAYSAAECLALGYLPGATSSVMYPGCRRTASKRPTTASRIGIGGRKAVDTFERRNGESAGRPRIKVTSWDELVALGGKPTI